MQNAVRGALAMGALLTGSALAQDLGSLTSLINPGDYKIAVNKVDSSEFPTIKLEFQVFPQKAGVATWKPAMGVRIAETVMGQMKPGKDVSAITACKIQDVVIGVALDVSGSVSDVLPEMQRGIIALFNKMQQEQAQLGTKDAGAVFAFSGENRYRFPEETATPLYTQNVPSVAQATLNIPSGGGSPIWEGMSVELTKLLAHQPPRPLQTKRVLATFTDGQDNASDPTATAKLLSDAQRGGAVLVNLGYGDEEPMALTAVAAASGGVYIPGVVGNIETTLVNLLQAMRTTYCVSYVSPHPNVVNEPSTVTIISGGSQGSAHYPLPFLIPEDSKDVALFMPVTGFQYQLLAAGGAMPDIQVKMELRGTDNQPWAAGQGPDRAYKTVEMVIPAAQAWVAEGGLLDGTYGFQIRNFSDPSMWNDLFAVPTGHVELHQDENRTVIDKVDHYVISASFVLPEGTAMDGRDYPSTPRLSIQDRTPPHLRVRLRPQDGGPSLETRTLENVTDEDPAIFVAGARPTYEGVKQAGPGAKKARFEYRGRTSESGASSESVLHDQHWALWVPAENGTGLTPKFRHENLVAIDDPDGKLFVDGLEVAAGTRLLLEIASRDNYAMLTTATAAADRDVFLMAGRGEDPVHARFDDQRGELQTVPAAAPFLPYVPKADLDANPKRPGITWWIKSPGDSRDRFADIEGITEVVYPVDDASVRIKQAASGETVPAGPIRLLVVHAQDGQGNVTVFELPITVHEAGFQARTLEWKTQKQAGFLD